MSWNMVTVNNIKTSTYWEIVVSANLSNHILKIFLSQSCTSSHIQVKYVILLFDSTKYSKQHNHKPPHCSTIFLSDPSSLVYFFSPVDCCILLLWVSLLILSGWERWLMQQASWQWELFPSQGHQGAQRLKMAWCYYITRTHQTNDLTDHWIYLNCIRIL